MKPASTTRSGAYDATVAASATSQSARLGKSRTRCTNVSTPKRSARLSPSMSSRSAPTATTRAPYAGSPVASRRAWRLVPEPETRTTRRAGGTRGSLGEVRERPGVARSGGTTRWPAASRPAHRGRGRPRRAGSPGRRTGPTSCIRPGPTEPPASAASPPTTRPARMPPAQPRTAPSSQRVVGYRRCARAAAYAATTGGTSRSSAIQDDGAPSSGRAASSGNAGTGPSTTAVGLAIVAVPTAKPGPSR